MLQNPTRHITTTTDTTSIHHNTKTKGSNEKPNKHKQVSCEEPRRRFRGTGLHEGSAGTRLTKPSKGFDLRTSASSLVEPILDPPNPPEAHNHRGTTSATTTTEGHINPEPHGEESAPPGTSRKTSSVALTIEAETSKGPDGKESSLEHLVDDEEIPVERRIELMERTSKI